MMKIVSVTTRAIAPIVGANQATVVRDISRDADASPVRNLTPEPAPRPTGPDLIAGTESTPEDDQVMDAAPVRELTPNATPRQGVRSMVVIPTVAADA